MKQKKKGKILANGLDAYLLKNDGVEDYSL